jgi:nitrate/TMAO reductase-like tetraheme cytochrome c subunit
MGVRTMIAPIVGVMSRLGGLSALVITVALLVWHAPAAGQAAKDNCAACHLEIGDERLAGPAKAFDEDIHKAKGFGCVDCHGGDAHEQGMEAMSPAKGFIGKPKHAQIPQLCGRCHSDAQFMKRYNPALRVDQVAEYATSVHGRRLRQFNDPKVAVCVSCHPAHSIRPPSDPKSTVYPLHVADTCGRCHADATYMAEYKIPTDQLAKYKTSIHWQTMSVKGDLSAPTCNSCHGNHGATPPGITWVGNVCGQCHSVMADLFKKSVHATAFAQMGSPGCATCHENHAIHAVSDAMLGLGDKAVCSTCHSKDDAGGKSAVEMRASIDSLASEYDKAKAILNRAEHAGMEVSQAQFDLNGAHEALVKARTAVHAFKVGAVTHDVEPGIGIAQKAYARGVRAMGDLKFRRNGFAISVLIIAGLIVGLVLKIRQVDRTGPPRD